MGPRHTHSRKCGRGRAAPIVVLSGLVLLVVVEAGTCAIKRAQFEGDMQEIFSAAAALEAGPGGRASNGGGGVAEQADFGLDDGDLLLLRGAAALVELFLGCAALTLGVLGLRSSPRRGSAVRQGSLLGLIGGVLLLLLAAYLALGLLAAVMISSALP